MMSFLSCILAKYSADIDFLRWTRSQTSVGVVLGEPQIIPTTQSFTEILVWI